MALASDDIERWFPMRVTYNRELSVKAGLDELGIANFVPMQYRFTGQDDRRHRELLPAVSNLVFVHSTQRVITRLKMECSKLEPMRYMIRRHVADRTTEILYVPDVQMDNFIRVASVTDDSVMFLQAAPELRLGQKVMITEGFFAGVTGVVRRIKGNKRVVVQIDDVAAAAITFVPPSQLVIVP